MRHTVGHPVAALLGDVVGSREAEDRQVLHDTLSTTLAEASADLDRLMPLRVTAGGQFRGSFPTVGEALYGALLLRLLLDREGIDVWVGVGWGDTTFLDREQGTQDGPAWWAAHDAVEWVKRQQPQAGWQSVRTAYRRAEAPHGRRRELLGPEPEPVRAALLCQDHLYGLMDSRSRHILEGLLRGRTQSALALELGLTRQAVNQRRKHDGLAVAVAAAESLRATR